MPDEEKKDKPEKAERSIGRVEKEVKRIGGIVDDVKSKLDTYEEVSGAGAERKRLEEETARAAAEEAIRKAGDKKEEEEKPAVSEDKEDGGGFSINFFK